MAANAQIGALHVSLGLDSAQFETGLKQTQDKLGRFGKLAGTAFTAVAAAGVAALAALGPAIKAAADNADALDDASQKIGVSVEALSRLGYVAKIEGHSIEAFTSALGKLSKSMGDVAMGSKGPAATAFSALGIAVTDASGQLRSADQVFADIAEKFARMEDGTTKTALAMSLFGRTGADLIPMLNHGRDGLARFGAEADRLGITISGKTAAAAAEFNDNLTRLSAVSDGLANKIMEALIPSLADLTTTMASPEFQGAIVNTTALLGGLADVLARTVILAGELFNVLPKAVGAGEDKSLYANLPGYEQFISQHEIGAGNASSGVGGGAGSHAGLLATMGVAPQAAKELTIDLGSLSGAADKAVESIDPLQARINELSDVLTITHDPITQMQLDLTDLDTMWREGRISVEQYGQAVARTQAGAAASVLGMASQISGSLADLFKDNKAFAVANAVINTAEGVTKALAQGGIWGFAGAAAVAVSGAAQIAAILSANPGSANAPAVPNSAAAGTQSESGGAPRGAAYITIQGDRFGRSHLEELATELADLMNDGGGRDLQIVLAGSS